MGPLQDDARFGDHVAGFGIDFAHLVEPREADDHFVAPYGNLRADEARIAALRHDADPPRIGPGDQRLHLRHVAGQGDCRGADVEALAGLV